LADHPSRTSEDIPEEELAKLREFISNNIIIECGDKVIDVIN
jgi:hypothetical protein